MTAKLLFVANNLNVGGPQKGLVALLEALDPERFECTVVSLQRGGDLRPYISSKARVLDVDETTYALQINRRTAAQGLFELLRRRMLASSVLYVAALAARTMGKPMNPWRQRVWASASQRLEPLPYAFDAAFAVSSGLATYFTVDCVRAPRKYHWVIGDYSRTAIHRATDLAYFGRTTGGLAVSDECARIFQSLFPELQQIITPFHQLIPWKYYEEQAGDAPEFADADGLKVLTVSRLDPDKGLELAVGACAALRSQGVPLRWVVLGDGAFRSELESMVAEHELGRNFLLPGFRNNVMDYMREADLFVLPSRSEGRSSAVDEALASGTPVVVANYRTAASQVSHGRNGLICGMDASSLAEAVRSFVGRDATEILRGPVGRTRQSEVEAANDLFARLARASTS